MLHLEEALIDERLTLPSMNVLPDKSIGNEFKHFSSRDGDVIPALLLKGVSQRMLLYVALNPM